MTGAKTEVAWPASVAPDPEACRWEWEREPQGVALLPASQAWDVLILPEVLGCPTLDVLTRVLDRPGPVLADFGEHPHRPGTAGTGDARGGRSPGPQGGGLMCGSRLEYADGIEVLVPRQATFARQGAASGACSGGTPCSKSLGEC
ncbi:hypothetical protein, partial [Streptomyces sp. NPDC001275]